MYYPLGELIYCCHLPDANFFIYHTTKASLLYEDKPANRNQKESSSKPTQFNSISYSAFVSSDFLSLTPCCILHTLCPSDRNKSTGNKGTICANTNLDRKIRFLSQLGPLPDARQAPGSNLRLAQQDEKNPLLLWSSRMKMTKDRCGINSPSSWRCCLWLGWFS